MWWLISHRMAREEEEGEGEGARAVTSPAECQFQMKTFPASVPVFLIGFPLSKEIA